MRTRSTVPELLPRLSAGAHRTARRGACFMEFASYLAGERWSDHPPCTDPVLASLARAVNDSVRDDRRDELLADVPRVIGLRGDDTMRLVIALRAASAALPVASMSRQRTLATAVMAILRTIDERGVRVPADLRATAASALESVPDAAVWARTQLATWPVRTADLLRGGCEVTVRTAAVGIAEACMPDPDALLIETLRAAIGDAEAYLESADGRADADRDVVRVERRVLSGITT